MNTHALERTSPTGKGQEFIGVCVRCGKEGLRLADIRSDPCSASEGQRAGETALLRLLKEKNSS